MAGKILAKIITTETIILYYCDLRQTSHVNTAVNTQLVIRKIDNEKAALFQALCEMFPEKEFSSRLKRAGWQCYVACCNDDIAGFAWVASGELCIDEINYNYSLSIDEIFIYDCFVRREFRGAGIYPAMLCRVIEENSRRIGSLKVAFIGVSSANKASRRGIQKAGFTEFNKIRYLQWFKHQKWWGVTKRPILD